MVQARASGTAGRGASVMAMLSSSPTLVSAPCLFPLPPLRAADTALLHAEIELLDVVLLEQPGAGVFHHDAADLQDVSVVGDVQRHVGVLLHEEDGHSPLAVDPDDDVEDLLHELG